MRVIAHRTIVEYGKQHANAKTSLDSWYKTTKAAKWKDFQDLKKTFNSADYVGNQR
jgi:mRNA interferase HigB